MIKKISHYFSKQLAANTEEQEILQYGFECLINTLIPLIFFFIFAIVKKMIVETIIWLILFLLLRNYIGGYHASSHGRCIVMSTIYGLITLFCICYFNSIPLTTEIYVCSLLIIFHILFGPIINDNDLIDNYRKYKIIGLIIIIVESILMIILNYKNIFIHSSLFFSIVSAELLHYAERVKRLNIAKN